MKKLISIICKNGFFNSINSNSYNPNSPYLYDFTIQKKTTFVWGGCKLIKKLLWNIFYLFSMNNLVPGILSFLLI